MIKAETPLQSALHRSGIRHIASEELHVGRCQNYGPFLGPYFNTAANISGTQKGTIILTTTHMVT